MQPVTMSCLYIVTLRIAGVQGLVENSARSAEHSNHLTATISGDGSVHTDAAIGPHLRFCRRFRWWPRCSHLLRTTFNAEVTPRAAHNHERAQIPVRQVARSLARVEAAPASRVPAQAPEAPRDSSKLAVKFLLGLLLVGAVAIMTTFAANMPREQIVQCMLSCAVAVGYLLTSSAIILTNKHLLNADRFPYPAPLMAFHQSCIWALASMLYMLVPSIFPSAQAALAPADSSNEETRMTRILTRMRPFAPVGFLTAVALLTSNYAYLYASVSFLQMVKEGNVVWIYCGSLLIGTEKFQWRLALSLVFVFLGACSAVDGEMHFVMLGLVIQLVCCLAESVRVIYMGYLMSGAGVQKIDPLSFVLCSAPVTLLMLSPLLVGFWDPNIPSRFVSCLPWVLLSTGLAFALQVLIAVGIKMLSGVGFVLVTILKDVIVVVVATSFMGESLSTEQIIGFSVCSAGILAYSLIKQMPQEPAPKTESK